jgi:hypothetical protein
LRPVDNRPIPNPVRRLSKKRQQELADKLAAEQEAEILSASSLVSLVDGESSDQRPSEVSDSAISPEVKNPSDDNVPDSIISESTASDNSSTSISDKIPEIIENAEHVIECSAPIPIEEALPEVSAPMLLFDEEVNAAACFEFFRYVFGIFA